MSRFVALVTGHLTFAIVIGDAATGATTTAVIDLPVPDEIGRRIRTAAATRRHRIVIPAIYLEHRIQRAHFRHMVAEIDAVKR